MIRADSASIHRSAAEFRRELSRNPDLSAEVLRDMLLRALEAMELLVEANDGMQDTLEQILARSNA